jgi:tRNA threonylcarbamoyladenosine biosynthesis protein TsaE
MPLTLDVFLPDLEATRRLGQHLGQLLSPGAGVALIGQLGAGKTHLVRAISEGLEVPDSRVVTSPTFVLIQEYQGRLPIYHFDAYRLAGEGPFADLGVYEYLEGEGVCLIEWAERVEGCLPAEQLRVTLTVHGASSREARLEARGARYEEVLAGLAQSLTPGEK